MKTDIMADNAETRPKTSGDVRKKQLSERGSWWITALKDTPSPGAYDVRDFLQDAQLNPVQKSYNFKGEGRKKKPNTGGSGEMLLPGCYNFPDMVCLTEKLPHTCSFKNTPRQLILLGIKDKEINTNPCQYNVVKPPVESLPCKHSMFRSGVRRFPTIYFVPKEGPGPCEYQVKTDSARGISSCFKSKVPRLRSTYSKTPGPGTYDPIRHLSKQPPTVARMGRLHGLFFRNSFDI
ncbi:protein STPG4 [Pelodytes ibericus]